jgi:phosphate:Na+ symporter
VTPFVLIGGALGGIGLFLLGMRLMTDGLKVTAGAMLREFLTRWTRTRFRGLMSGILITGIVQSSSAVTVAAIGFVNAGVLTLGQAMWVIFGSNVGTTITGWIVALVGFDVRIEAFALPLLGAGMFLSLTGAATRRGAFGEAIAGFGVFFLGIATLKATFAGLGGTIDMASFVGDGVANVALFVVLGFILTSLMQSSSAVMAIALTAAGSGVLTIEAGAALVIGANVGTTSTALLAVIGATPNAKRVAVSHVVFNVLTAVMALLLLPVLLLTVRFVESSFGSAAGAAATLALFHTAFNILGVLIIWPLSGILERWLTKRFVTEEENESRPRHLDRNSLEVPALAVNSILLEVRRVAAFSLGIARTAFTDPSADIARLSRRSEIIHRLNDAIVDYIQTFGAAKTSAQVAEAMTHPIRALWHFIEIADLGLSAARLQPRLVALPAGVREDIDAYGGLIAGEIDRAQRVFEDPDETLTTGATIKPVYQHAKTGVLVAAANGTISAGQAEDALELLSDMKTALRHIDRANKRIAAIRETMQPADERADEEAANAAA